MKVFLFLWAVALAIGVTAGLIWPAPEDLTFLDVGQGDCAVLRHRGVTILIDDGPLSRSGNPAVVKALRRRGIGDVDLILLSHPDADHTGGTATLVNEYPEAKIGISAAFETQPKMLQEIKQWGIKPDSIMWFPPESQVRIQDCSLEILCPPVGPRDDDNKGSMFVHLDDEGATADFSGDAPMSVEDELAPLGPWRADILHVGHHGSRTATSSHWLTVVHPSVAVISCGRDNSYGHPHKATLDRLASFGVPVARTDLDGDLAFAPVDGHFRSVR